MKLNKLLKYLEGHHPDEEIFIHRPIIENGNIVGANIWELKGFSKVKIGRKEVICIDVVYSENIDYHRGDYK